MAEQQSAHRQRMEWEDLELQKEAMRKEFLESRIGQACAFLIALAFIGGGVYVIANGHEWVGAAVCGGGVGLHALVSAFLQRPQPIANTEAAAPKPKVKLPKNQK